MSATEPTGTTNEAATGDAGPGLPESIARVAANAEERGEGICRTCLEPIWREGGTVGRQKREGWSDRNERGGDSLVCFKAVQFRHVPLLFREAAIYDGAARAAREDVPDLARRLAEAEAKVARVEALADEWADRKRSDGISGNAWIGLTLAGVAADLRAALADPAP